MTSTDPLTERYVALGRIFDNCLVALARADADYLEGPRARVDAYRGALVGLNVIAEAIAEARKAGLCIPCEGAMVPRAAVLPAPLLVLMREFMDMLQGRKSQLLARDSTNNGSMARCRREARLRALAVEHYAEFRRYGWSVPKASSEIARAFVDAGSKDVTVKTVREWAKQCRKTTVASPKLVDEERQIIREDLDGFRRQVFKVAEISTSIEVISYRIPGYAHVEVSIGYAHVTISKLAEYDFGDDIRCMVLLDRLRADIRSLIVGVNKS